VNDDIHIASLPRDKGESHEEYMIRAERHLRQRLDAMRIERRVTVPDNFWSHVGVGAGIAVLLVLLAYLFGFLIGGS
jgi:hypothetical protein